MVTLYFTSIQIVSGIDVLATPGLLNETKSILPLCESFGQKLHSVRREDEVDFRWEKEWRLVGSFQFRHDEVAFGLCPVEKIPEFEKLVNNAFPFIDPDWDPDQLKNYLISKGAQQLADAL